MIKIKLEDEFKEVGMMSDYIKMKEEEDMEKEKIKDEMEYQYSVLGLWNVGDKAKGV